MKAMVGLGKDWSSHAAGTTIRGKGSKCVQQTIRLRGELGFLSDR